MLDRGRSRVLSENESVFIECGRLPEHRFRVDSERFVDPSQVLCERMTTDHDARPPVSREPAHGPQQGLQFAVIALTSVALALTAALERSRDQALDHVREGRSPVGDDLRRGALARQRRGEKPLC